jgi:hypothetical protein
LNFYQISVGLKRSSKDAGFVESRSNKLIGTSSLSVTKEAANNPSTNSSSRSKRNGQPPVVTVTESANSTGEATNSSSRSRRGVQPPPVTVTKSAVNSSVVATNSNSTSMKKVLLLYFSFNVSKFVFRLLLSLQNETWQRQLKDR